MSREVVEGHDIEEDALVSQVAEWTMRATRLREKLEKAESALVEVSKGTERSKKIEVAATQALSCMVNLLQDPTLPETNIDEQELGALVMGRVMQNLRDALLEEKKDNKK